MDVAAYILTGVQHILDEDAIYRVPTPKDPEQGAFSSVYADQRGNDFSILACFRADVKRGGGHANPLRHS